MAAEIYKAGCSGALRPPHPASEFMAHFKMIKAHYIFGFQNQREMSPKACYRLNWFRFYLSKGS